jgi:hypothetical protein
MSNYLKNLRTAPLKAVAARVLEFLPKDSISVDKMEEWAYQSYESIAPREIYEVRIATLDVRNHKAPLPIGLYDIEMVLYRSFDNTSYKGRTNPYSTETSEFTTTTEVDTNVTTDRIKKTTITTEITDTNVKLNSGMDNGVFKQELPDGSLEKEQIYYNANEARVQWKPLRLATNVFHNSVLLNAPRELYSNCDEAFSIQDGCFVTTFSEGQLAIAYTGIPTNEEGEYVYADYEYVSAAIEAALLKNYWKWKFNTGNVAGAGQKYKQFASEYELLAPKASAALMMPDLIQYQNIRNMNKFIKEDSPFATVMGALNNTETLNFRNPPRYGNAYFFHAYPTGVRRF